METFKRGLRNVVNRGKSLESGRRGRKTKSKTLGKPTEDATHESYTSSASLEAPTGVVKQAPKKDPTLTFYETRVKTNPVTYDMVLLVTESWEKKVYSIPNWKSVVGELYLRKLFQLSPESIEIMGFPTDTRHDDPKLFENVSNEHKGIKMMEAVDKAISLLGPELEILEEVLRDLGVRHIAYGVKPHQWPVVGAALMHVLQQGLQDDFNDELQGAWSALYDFLSYHMLSGMLSHPPDLTK